MTTKIHRMHAHDQHMHAAAKKLRGLSPAELADIEKEVDASLAIEGLVLTPTENALLRRRTQGLILHDEFLQEVLALSQPLNDHQEIEE